MDSRPVISIILVILLAFASPAMGQLTFPTVHGGGETAGQADALSYDYDFTTGTVSGHPNTYAYSSGSSQYITLADDDQFSFGDGSDNTTFSVCAVVNYARSNAEFPIISKGGIAATDAGAEWAFFIASDGRLTFYTFDDSTDSREGIYASFDYWNELGGGWTIVCATMDCSSISNGTNQSLTMNLAAQGQTVQDTTSDVAGSTYVATENTSSAVYIGRHDSGGTPAYTDGNIGMIFTTSDVISTAEIQAAFYESCSTLTANNIRWCYDFGEDPNEDLPGTGCGGSGCDGTLNGSLALDSPASAPGVSADKTVTRGSNLAVKNAAPYAVGATPTSGTNIAVADNVVGQRDGLVWSGGKLCAGGTGTHGQNNAYTNGDPTDKELGDIWFASHDATATTVKHTLAYSDSETATDLALIFDSDASIKIGTDADEQDGFDSGQTWTASGGQAAWFQGGFDSNAIPYDHTPGATLANFDYGVFGLYKPTGGEWKLLFYRSDSAVSDSATELYFNPVTDTASGACTDNWRIYEDATIGVMTAATLLSDAFTDTNSTDIAAHTPNVSQDTWTESRGNADIQSNRLSMIDAGGEVLVTIDAVQSDAVCKATVNVAAEDGGEYHGMYVRYNASNDDGFLAAVDSAADTFYLLEENPTGTYTVRDSASVTINTATDYEINVATDGADIDAWLAFTTHVGYGSATRNQTSGIVGLLGNTTGTEDVDFDMISCFPRNWNDYTSFTELAP